MDAAAAAMPHDDDVADAHAVDRELDGGRGAVLPGIGLVGRNEIGDVAQDEQFARSGIEDRLGCRATVAAGDDHGGGLLSALRQFLVAAAFARIPLGHEGPVAVDQVVRKGVHGERISDKPCDLQQPCSDMPVTGA